jgi:threonine synthase
MLMVTDQEIARAQRILAEHEGIFGEPASATSLAGLIKAQRTRLVQEAARVFCVSDRPWVDGSEICH